ncbi:MAG: DUF4440 domain-containing protein [Chthoniobacterales bacterium]
MRLFFLVVVAAIAAGTCAHAQDAASNAFREPTPRPEESPTPAPTPEKRLSPAPGEEVAPSPEETPTPEQRSTPAAEQQPLAPSEPAASIGEEEKRPSKKQRKLDSPSEARDDEDEGAPIGYFDLRNTLRNLEDKWEKSIVKHDVKVVAELVADDFVGTGSNGKVGGKATLIREAKNDKNTYESARARHMSLRGYGANVAVVTGVATEVGKTPEGREFEHSYRFTDTWLRRRGKWQCIASHAALVPKK